MIRLFREMWIRAPRIPFDSVSFHRSIDRRRLEISSEKKEGGRKEDRYGNLSELPWRNAFSFGARGNSLTRSRRGQRKDDEGGLLTSKV